MRLYQPFSPFVPHECEMTRNTRMQRLHPSLDFPRSIPTRHRALRQGDRIISCVRGWGDANRMTIRNTLQDHGQRYRPRMACLKKVGFPLTRGFVVTVWRLYLQTHLQIGYTHVFLRNAGAVELHSSLTEPECVGICSLGKPRQCLFSTGSR